MTIGAYPVVMACGMLAGALLLSAAPGRTTPGTPPPVDGEAVFARECGMCHARGGTGTMMLGRRLGAENALLADRRDLDADYVAAAVRGGINSMPAITRVEVTDEDLAAIAGYLTRDRNGEGGR